MPTIAFTVTDAASCGGDSAPTVASTTPASNATGVAANSDITVTFNEAVTTTGSWYTISCASSGVHTATASGGPTSYTLNPDSDFASGESCTVTVLAANVTDNDATDPPDTMAADYQWSFTVAASNICGDPATLISAVQGSGTTSALNGTVVTVEGIVVADLQGASPNFNGYFLQEEDSDQDGDPSTAEGIFVYASATAVNAGERVRVTGTVTEFSNLTELSPVTSEQICATGQAASVTATSISLPVAALTDWERYEGMLVTFPQPLHVTDNYSLGRYGQVGLSVDDRLYQPTNVVTPGPASIALQALNDRSRIILDDAQVNQNPDPVRYPAPGLSASNTLRLGATTSNLTGVLDNFFASGLSQYRVQPISTVSFTDGANPRPTTPPTLPGVVRIASFNVLNYFNGDGMGGGFPTPRGATTAAEFDRQRDKIINAIATMDADVVGLMEIENDSGATSAIQDLVDGLNSVAGAGPYSYIDTGVIGSDEIRVALLYQPARVTPVGAYQLLTAATAPAGTTFDDSKNRPALAQSFDDVLTGERFSVVVNHLKSKGSTCGDDDDDTATGQGNCNGTRTNAAEALAAWIASDPTGSSDADYLIIGDLNAYAKEDPIVALEDAGFVNLVAQFGGLYAYSYQFNGQSGYLDHALATASLAPQVGNSEEWHINADEPIALDYNVEFKTVGQISSFYSDEPFRASDHDPAMVSLFPYDFSDGPLSYPLAWHTGNGALRLGSSWTADHDVLPGSDDGSDNGIALDLTNGMGTADVQRSSGSGGGWLTGWIDWDANGTFDGDEIVVNQAVSLGSNAFTFTVPGDANSSQTLWARFRLYDSATEPARPTPAAPTASSPLGAGIGGEVEEFSIAPLAVTLASFSATGQGDSVQVAWQSASERNNLGFNVLRATSPDGPTTPLNDELILSQGAGSGEGYSYSLLDEAVQGGTTYWYWLEAVATDGSTARYGPVSASPSAPTAVSLGTATARPAAQAPWLALLSAGLLLGLGLVWLRRR